jgi:hypothetical protein
MTRAENNTSFFMNSQRTGFGTAVPIDEKMHHDANSSIDDPALVETQFFSFNIPEAQIMSLCYQWAHPNLRLFSGGPWVWQGIKTRQLSAELIHLRDFMPDHPIRRDGDLDGYTMTPSGYTVEIIEPLQKARITYTDAARDNNIDVTFDAIMPPAMIASGKHFDQVMRTHGRVRLRGQEFIVDGYGARDRSWGETRPEDPRQAPPVHYMVPIFGDDFALNIVGIEDPDADPIWKDIYPFDAAMAAQINRGWVWIGGELLPLTSLKIRTEWDLVTGIPKGHKVDCVDANGRSYALTATVTSACPWNTWSNAEMDVCLARWECDGRVGHGDAQLAVWTDFTQLLN